MCNFLDKYIHNKEINISKDEWININNEYDRDSIIKAFKESILNDDIKLPLRNITLSDAKSSFIELNYQCPNSIEYGILTTRYEYSFSPIGYGRYIDESNVGSLASDYFHQESRFLCDSINSPSPYRTWHNSKFLDGLLKALWTLKCKEVNSNTLRTCLALRKYIASQFKPAVAKSIYTLFDSRDILDFSAGWGDRLCGFYASNNTKSYIGIDPNILVYDKYQEQVDLYKTLTKEKHTEFICKPAEEVDLPESIVDTVFTSPPYFNIERYSTDETQSYKRYRKLDEWLNGFLFKAISLSVRALKKDGYLIINISDVYSGHKVNKICDPMNEYIKSLGLKYCDMLGMKMAKRPNSLADKEGIFIEPIWIWQKI